MECQVIKVGGACSVSSSRILLMGSSEAVYWFLA